MRHGQQDYRAFMDDLDPPTEELDLPAIARASDIETCLSTDTARTDDTGFSNGSLQMPRCWWDPPWTLTEPWRITLFRGGDEYGRETLAFHLGPLGMFVWATNRTVQP